MSVRPYRNPHDEFNILLSVKLIRMSLSRSAFYTHHRRCLGLAVKNGQYLSQTPYCYHLPTTANARVRFAFVLAQLPIIQNACRRFFGFSLAQFSLYNRQVGLLFSQRCGLRPVPLFTGLTYRHKFSRLVDGFN